MKNFTHIIICFAVAMLFQMVSAGSASCQETFPNHNIDTDIRDLRNSIAPNFRYCYDDYLQYSPSLILVGLKAFKYEGRSSWGRMLTADAFSYAIMGLVTNGLKYSICRMRPDMSQKNSFPSGHTATAFMMATWLHKEYGWRNPWISFAGYSIATITGVSRILNNRHYMSDVVAGAAIGIGSVHLGYWLSDLIFKDKHYMPNYEKPEFFYDTEKGHYVGEISFGRRFILGKASSMESCDLPYRGSYMGLSVEVPFSKQGGISANVKFNSLRYKDSSTNVMYNALVGTYWNWPFAKILEAQARIGIGYAWHPFGNGLDMSAGAALSLITGNNVKLKLFADYEAVSFTQKQSWLNSIILGYSAAFFW